MPLIFLLLLPRFAENIWLAIFMPLFLNLIAAYSGLEAGFAEWRPQTRAGRMLRGWMYSTWWLREGDGKRWVRAAWGLLGLAFMGPVVFALAWAAWG